MRKDKVKIEQIGTNFKYPFLFADCDGKPLIEGDAVKYNGGLYYLRFCYDYKSCNCFYCLSSVKALVPHKILVCFSSVLKQGDTYILHGVKLFWSSLDCYPF